jgi:hypothetical protein
LQGFGFPAVCLWDAGVFARPSVACRWGEEYRTAHAANTHMPGIRLGWREVTEPPSLWGSARRIAELNLKVKLS